MKHLILVLVAALVLSNTATADSTKLFRGHTAAYWHWRWQASYKQKQSLTKTTIVLAHKVQALRVASRQESAPDVFNAIHLAALTYGQSESDMRGIAYCESRFTPGESDGLHGPWGLFQFLESTWNGTPYASESPFNAYANAFAAAWLMHKDGSTREWQCLPSGKLRW